LLNPRAVYWCIFDGLTYFFFLYFFFLLPDLTPVDSDGDGTPDYLDTDSDSGGGGVENNDGGTNGDGQGPQCSPGMEGAPLCWWVWLLLLLLLLCCCLCFILIFCWRSKRPRIFVRLDQAGENGKTAEDERLFVVYVENEHDSIRSVVNKLCDKKKFPSDLAQALKLEKTMGLFHGGQACHLTQSNPMVNQNGVAAPKRKKSIFIDFTDSYDSNADDFDSQLSDYGVQPLTSNTAPGKNKKQKIIRMEAAILDIRAIMMQNNPMGIYSPRKKSTVRVVKCYLCVCVFVCLCVCVFVFCCYTRYYYLVSIRLVLFVLVF